jgi:hypothetical protein
MLAMPGETGTKALYDLVDSGVDCFEEAEEMLRERGRYYVLSRLYQQRGMTERVLETWGNMIDGTWPDEAFKHGEERMRDYLVKCRDTDVMFRYAMWLVKRNAEAGVQVRTPFSLRVLMIGVGE